MEKANVEISRLADEFIRESKTIKTKSEFLYKLGEYERRILESQKPWHPTAQIQQLVYEAKVPTAPMLHNPFAPNQNQQRNYRTVSSNFRQTQSGFAPNRKNDFGRFGGGLTNINSSSNLPKPPQGLADTMMQMARPRDQFPFQHNEFLKEHLQEQPQYVKFYKKQVQVSPFHTRKF